MKKKIKQEFKRTWKCEASLLNYYLFVDFLIYIYIYSKQHHQIYVFFFYFLLFLLTFFCFVQSLLIDLTTACFFFFLFSCFSIYCCLIAFKQRHPAHAHTQKKFTHMYIVIEPLKQRPTHKSMTNVKNMLYFNLHCVMTLARSFR